MQSATTVLLMTPNSTQNVEAPQYITGEMDLYYRDKPEIQRDECMRSGGLIAMSLMLLAEEMGYSSCPMDGFDFAEVGKMIHLPKDHCIAMMVAIGKPAPHPTHALVA